MATPKNPDSPTPPTPPAAAEKAKPPGAVLLFNESRGPYVCNHTAPRSADRLPKGAGKDDPRERIDITRIMVPPGLFLLDGPRFALCEPNNGFRGRVAEGSMLIVTDDPDADWVEQWLEVRPNRAVDMIEDSGNVDTLEALLEIEDRTKVRDALTRQIMVVNDESQQQRLARSSQRNHNRARGGGRKSRTRGLVN